MKILLLKILRLLASLVRIALLLWMLMVLISFVTPSIDNIEQYPTLMKLDHIEHQISFPVLTQIKMAIPYTYNDKDYSGLILIICILFLMHFCTLVKEKSQETINQSKRKAEYFKWRNQAQHNISKEKLQEMDNKFESLSATKASDRKRILKEFVALKSKLDSMGQQLAFLAIDVVDSTGMKRDEDKHLIVYDFDRYNEIVNECLKKNGVVKFAMTPDGIMSCFRTVDMAVQAAVNLMDRLKEFNKNEKKIKRDFQVRCGINAGFVYVDEDTPLEQVSDRVIDIAGHMQKYAKPDSINIAASAIEPLKNRGGFSETTDVIDEQKVYEWSAPEEEEKNKPS